MINHRDTEDTEVGDEKVTLTLSRSEALVLFEWLASRESDLPERPPSNEPEQLVLWGMESQLERLLVEPFSADYGQSLAAARQHVLASISDQWLRCLQLLPCSLLRALRVSVVNNVH